MSCINRADCECRDCREKKSMRERRRFCRDDDRHYRWDEEVDGEELFESLLSREINRHCERESDEMED